MLGIILVVVGAVALVLRLADVALGADAWPLWIVVPGLAMLVASFAIPRGGVGLAIPGAMLTMVGLVLTAQRALDAYATWAYAWALVAPTGVGLGMLAYGAARRDGVLVRDGLRIAGIGLALFAAFGLFFEGVLGLSGTPISNIDTVLPYAAIGFGIVLLLLSLLGSGRRSGTRA